MTTQNEQAACAHLGVAHKRIDHADRTCSDRWECLDCHKAFVPISWTQADPVGLIATLQKQVKLLREALQELADSSPCQNGYKPDDMSCASNKARAALTSTEPKP